MQRSVAACLAAILDLAVSEVPVPDEQHPAPWVVWRNWVAQRALGRVPIQELATVNWPGSWLAVLREVEGNGDVGAVAFGAPPGIAWHPLGALRPSTRSRWATWFLPADVALWASAEEPASAPWRRS